MNKKYITPAIIVCEAKIGNMMLNLSIIDGNDNGDGNVLTKPTGMWDYYVVDDEEE